MNLPRPNLRVVVADDDAFTTSLVAEGLRSQGFEVATAGSPTLAWELVTRLEPHAIVSDLSFWPGESGVAMLRQVREVFPWVGIVVLTSHQSPELAVGDSGQLPSGVVYLVKTQLQQIEHLGDAVMNSISGDVAAAADQTSGTIILTPAQADVLRMLADGASTKAVAEFRGTTVRAAETMLGRLYSALGLENDERSNQRVAAVRLWQQGLVIVR